jgi:two-component system cell cycle response regulator
MAARILIVEDNPANLELMRYMLHAYGYHVLMASDGAQAIEVAEREIPDLILCDIQMPQMDGYEVVRRLRNNPRLVTTPVVAVTALAMVGDRDKTIALGFDGYLAKPVDPTTLIRQVESFLATELRAAPSPASAPSTPELAKPPLTGKTILAVDDHRSNLDLVVSIFGRSGYRVVTTTDSNKVLPLALEIVPDLILSDMCMPQGSGFDLIKAIKAEPVLKNIPFVFVTSTMVDDQARKTGLALGAAKVLFRPIEPARLLAEIESCFEPGGH